MEKRILSIVLIYFGIGNLIAQDNIKIFVDQGTTDYSGVTYTVNLDPTSPELLSNVLEVHFSVHNSGNSAKQLQVVRKRLSVPNSWNDQVCWPPNCYNTSNVEYTTPNSNNNPAPTIEAGASAELKPRITVDVTSTGTASYRYYLKDVATSNRLDSVDLIVNFTAAASIPVVKQTPNFTISPNPADHHITVSTSGMESCTIRVVDVLGNEMYNEEFSGTSKYINVSEYKTGVYFVLVEPAGSKTINRKLIVKH